MPWSDPPELVAMRERIIEQELPMPCDYCGEIVTALHGRISSSCIPDATRLFTRRVSD